MRNVEDITVHLACIDDMVRLKHASGRKQDHADLEHYAAHPGIKAGYLGDGR